jgi:KH domain-containing protein
MKKILSEKIPRIIKAKKQLEKELHVKISNRGKELYIEGSPENEYTAEKVIDSINLGFPIEIALSIKKDDNLLEVLNIKDYTRRKDYQRIRSRLIGKNGKTLKNLNQLTKCGFEIKDNQIGIIGPPECIQNAQQAIISLIQGAKQANVYSYLEKHQP